MNAVKNLSFEVSVYDSRTAMGAAAAQAVSRHIRALLDRQPKIRMIFAAAPSQNEFLDALVADTSIDFSRIEAFHMDEYVGLPDDAPQGFGNFLRRGLFDRVSFGAVHFLNGNAPDIQAECDRYAALLNEAPIDIVCLGIGENGHIAFNDPAVADLNDPLDVKLVSLDEICRNQQVHDGCFAALDLVPRTALTLTVPRLCRAGAHFCIVPAAAKREAVSRTIFGPITSDCPATALRTCRQARLFLDSASGADLLP